MFNKFEELVENIINKTNESMPGRIDHADSIGQFHYGWGREPGEPVEFEDYPEKAKSGRIFVVYADNIEMLKTTLKAKVRAKIKELIDSNKHKQISVYYKRTYALAHGENLQSIYWWNG